VAHHVILPRKPGERDRQVITTWNSGRRNQWPESSARRHMGPGDTVLDGSRLSQIGREGERSLSQQPTGERFRGEHTPEGGKTPAYDPDAS